MEDFPKYLIKALEVAKLSECRFAHGAVVVSHGNILSLASNRNRNTPSPQVPLKDISYHAEVAAIRQVKNPRGAVLYVSRYSRETGQATISRPCESCWNVIQEVGISKVIYTTFGNRWAMERA